MDALVLSRAHVAPSHPQASELAQKWQGMIQSISSENPAAMEQFENIGANRAFGAADNPKLLEEAYEYIQKALESRASPTSSEFGV